MRHTISLSNDQGDLTALLPEFVPQSSQGAYASVEYTFSVKNVLAMPEMVKLMESAIARVSAKFGKRFISGLATRINNEVVLVILLRTNLQPIINLKQQ